MFAGSMHQARVSCGRARRARRGRCGGVSADGRQGDERLFADTDSGAPNGFCIGATRVRLRSRPTFP